MPNDLEYVVKGALMQCNKGSAPVPFNPTYNTTLKMSGCLVSTEADKIPMTNIPSFGSCAARNGNACTPAPILWKDTFKVKVKKRKTLLFKSNIVCGTGGKIEFITSGQVPLPPEEMDKLMEEHGEEEGGWGWWDTAELIPVVGSIIGAVREGVKGNWGMMALNIGFLAMDVAGLLTFGATTAAATAAKTSVKAGTKIAAKSAAKAAAKSAGKATAKTAIKKGAGKAFASAVGKAVDKVAITRGIVCVTACFPAGTPIATKDGHKNIEDIAIGDLVWAYDEETGTSDLKPVLKTIQNEVDATLQLTLGEEVIETTAEHPFYTQTGWKDAADITTKDHVRTKNGNWQRVEATNFLYTRKKVYNFEVADLHNYFVGKLKWLVHNATVCIKGVIKKVSKRLLYLGRTPGKASKTGREVFERMLKEGNAKVLPNGKKMFRDATDGKWYDISKADMGHIEDAVTWWNKTGRKFGAKSKEVRKWMLDSKNYAYEYYKTNRSKGAILGKTTEYLPPLK